jgi:hypothetical protein
MTPVSTVSFVPDRFGNSQSALFLNSGYCTVPPGVYFNSSFTITAWVYPKDLSYKYQRILDFSNGGSQNEVAFAYAVSSLQPYILIFYGTSGSTFKNSFSSTLINSSQWSHVAVVYDGSNLILYVNGVQSGGSTSDVSSPDNIVRSSCFIGRSSWVSDTITYLDDLKIYQRALTAQEILADFN